MKGVSCQEKSEEVGQEKGQVVVSIGMFFTSHDDIMIYLDSL